ncbi:MAG: WXG100 family type VII secretion target [Corynebacterium sp.]|nr:WXG100 family type VII secretion target [Corynebacterium sp.]
MSTFITTSATMRDAARNVDSVNQSVQAQLARIKGTVFDLSANWQGAAQASFTELMNRWDEHARNLSQALRVISETIVNNANLFDAQEEQNRNAFSGLNGSLG